MDQQEVDEWHRAERASLLRQIDALSTGKRSSRKKPEPSTLDNRARAIVELKRRLAELERIVAG